ncbi:MAG: amidohydrolase [Candidatus Sumerlaeia bacterium]|nr:amidohydrolase [Candidatus Sumerlaeia bacterium]
MTGIRRTTPAAARLRALAAAACAALLAAALPAQHGGLDATGERAVAFTGATILTVSGEPLADGTLVLRNGLVEAVGPSASTTVPAGAAVVDASGKFIMPGIIDAHSHMGVYSWPGVEANSDGNEMTAPVTAQVRAEDSVNLEDPAFERARAGGVTTVLVLPGSGNMISGEGVVLKLRPVPVLEAMKMAEAPRQLKMAMGENPKRVYGGRGQLPSTRMGLMAKLRETFTKAEEYRAKKARHAEAVARYEAKLAEYEAHAAAGALKEDEERPEAPDPPEFDALNETLVDVLEGRVRVNVHCYRRDDIEDILRISDEYGFPIASLHHALEAYKLAPELARRRIAVATWPDWWGFKMEAWDATPEAVAILANAGVNTVLKSDSSDVVQRMFHEAAKARKYGMTEPQALASITLAPAKALGIDKWVGSLEPGKHADVAVFSKHPFDMYTRVEMTFIDGRQVFDRAEYEAAQTHPEYTP